jgi:hypothetical protein
LEWTAGVTLREAITSINAGASVNADVSGQAPGAYGPSDTINFNIAGAGTQTIGLNGSSLPFIVKAGHHQWLFTAGIGREQRGIRRQLGPLDHH